jgi:hypothetical protein
MATARAARIILWQLSLSGLLYVAKRSSSTDVATLLAISSNASWLPGSIILDHVCHTYAHQQEHQASKQFTRRNSRTYISIIALRWGGGCAAHQIIIMVPCKCGELRSDCRSTDLLEIRHGTAYTRLPKCTDRGHQPARRPMDQPLMQHARPHRRAHG